MEVLRNFIQVNYENTVVGSFNWKLADEEKEKVSELCESDDQCKQAMGSFRFCVGLFVKCERSRCDHQVKEFFT